MDEKGKANMQLKRIHLIDFCGFKDFSIQISDLTVLTGPNNGGKTTILRAVKLAFDGLHEALGEIRTWPSADEQLTVAQGGRPKYGAKTQLVVRRQGWANGERLLQRKGGSDEAKVELTFDVEGEELTYECVCNGKGQMSLSFQVNGRTLMSPREGPHLLIRPVYEMGCYFIRSLSGLHPAEPLMSYKQFVDARSKGKPEDVWRNEMQWLYEGKLPRRTQRVVDAVARIALGTEVLTPSRSRTSSEVLLRYLEDGNELEISAGGAGLLTAIYVISVLELADAHLLLFDEPDAHLHPSVQGQIASHIAQGTDADRQIILATHSPEMIQTFPLDSIRWVDRKEKSAKRCDGVGAILADLGAVAYGKAVTLQESKFIFVEDEEDERGLTILADKLGKDKMFGDCHFVKLKGCGDTKYLGGVCRVLQNVAGDPLTFAGVFDNDYEHRADQFDKDDEVQLLVAYLPCKELENLLLSSSTTLLSAAQRAAQNRKERTGKRSDVPTGDEIERKIDEVTGSAKIKSLVRPQWVSRFYARKRMHPPGPADVKDAGDEFEEAWADAQYRRRNCPGKAVLREIRGWLQDNYSFSVGSTNALFHSYEPDERITELFERVEAHLAGPAR